MEEKEQSKSSEKLMKEKAKEEKALQKDPNYQKSLVEKKFLDGFDASQETIEDVKAKFEVDPEIGLTEKEAQKRLNAYGPNKLIEAKKETVMQMFLWEFKDPLVLILLVAAVIDAVIAIINGNEVADWAEVAVILAIVILNAVIGTAQEAKAAQSLEALKKMSSPSCTVRRDGKLKTVKATEVALGDVVILEEGTITPADVRLTTSVNLKSDEASLTGESVPSEKDCNALLKGDHAVGDESNIAHSSCPISYGRGEGIVVGTGMNTQIGKIASMLQENNEETPLQKKLAELGKILGFICIGIVVAMFIVGLLWLIPSFMNGTFKPEDIINLFTAAIALAVAAVPEGLPAVVTIVLAMGMSKMVKVNAIVRKLPSVETLGAVTYVCSDKTGTLTQNRMTIKKVYANNQIIDADKVDIHSEEFELVTKGMMLDSNASINGDRYGDPTEIALLDFAHLFNIEKEETEKSSLPRIDEMPFDSVRKMMSTMHVIKDIPENATLKKYEFKNSEADGTIIFTKGALDSILSHTNRILINGEVRDITDGDIANINNAAKELAQQAFRVLAFAIHNGEKINEDNLIYVGMVAMIDPPRLEAKPAVEKLHRAGITTVMITGDHADTALAIGRELGIATSPEQTMTGAEIDKCTPEQLQELVKTKRIFARVSPENKVEIVKAIKANGGIAAMTGDGVNDAPSLKAADVGIAMGITGTDVAKSAADIVLADDNFASIEKAVEEGRGIYSNIKKTIFFLLSSNFAEILVMFLATCANIIAPMTAMQLLWINLITDSLPAIALGRDDKDPDIMNNAPRNPKDGIFAHGGFKFNMFYGFIIFIIVFAAFLIPVIYGMTQYNLTWNQMMASESLKEALIAGRDKSTYANWNDVYNALNTGTNLNSILSADGIKSMEIFLNANPMYAKGNTGTELDIGEAIHAISCFEDARTMAFTTLGLAELFHMIGMSNIKKSFIYVFKGTNWFFIVAFGFGLILQILVTEVPGLTDIFLGHSNGLEWYNWMICAALGIVPLIVHEIAVPFFRKREVI